MADIQAQLADGTILSFPEGTPDDVINSTVENFIASQPAPIVPGQEPQTVGERDIAVQGQQQARTLPRERIDAISPEALGRAGEAFTEPFEQTNFGFDPDTERTISDFKQNLTTVDKAFLNPILSIGEGGLAIMEGIAATIKGTAGGLASLTRTLTGGNETAEKKLSRDLDLAANLGLLIGGVRPTTGAIPKVGVGQRTTTKPATRGQIKAAAPTEEVLRADATAAYKAVEDAGVSFKQAGVQKLIKNSTKNVGRVNAKLHPNTTAAMEEVALLGEKEVVTLTELEEVRKIIGDATQATAPADARLARILRDSVDDFVLKVKPSQINSGKAVEGAEQLTKARDLWQRLRKSEVVSRLLEKADLVKNPGADSIRNQFAALLKNEKKSKLFNKAEISAMEKVAKGNSGEKVLDVLAKFAPQNSLTSLIGIGGGGAVAGVPGAVLLPVAGQIARTSAAAIKKSNAEFVQALVRTGVDAERANRAVIIKNHLEALGTFESQAAENLARMLAFGIIDFGEGKQDDQ